MFYGVLYINKADSAGRGHSGRQIVMGYGLEQQSRGRSRFRLQRELGRGSMGVVYEALDEERKVLVALKTLLHVNADDIYSLKREFRALQDIVHPNLCGLGELVEEDGRWFYVMELVDGVDFLTYTTKGGDVPGFVQATSRQIRLSRAPAAAPMGKGSCQGYDEDRLRKALGGVVNGLTALHRAGKIHRDIKPNNVIVTNNGRAVLLDFGLIVETSEARKSSLRFAGTPEYMAPEQADGVTVGPEVDWYALGVMLYEVLTGSLPFSGSPIKILMDKQVRTPDPPSILVDGVPEDLDRLCADLLNVDPQARPSAEDVISRLQLNEVSEPTTLSTHLTLESVAQGHIFVGRQDERKVLHRAFEDVLKGHGVSVVIEGVSGVGKSALVRRFASELRDAYPDIVILSGRCYERESVPFKAFDGVVDALARHMRHIPEMEAAKLTPRNASLLARLFPTLNRVGPIAGESQPRYEIVDPHEMQRRAFHALREVFCLLADRHPLVVFIDDMQWTDSDSLLLLGEILHRDESPPMLLVLSSRYVKGGSRSALEWESCVAGDLRRIYLQELNTEASQELARMYLDRASARTSSIGPDEIAAEAGGHPLYIAELVRHTAQMGKDDLGQLRLDDVIWHRVEQLSNSARCVLEFSCVAGAPLQSEYLFEISQLTQDEFTTCVKQLRVAKLLRSQGTRKSNPIEPYHDRVRESVLSHLSAQNKAHELHLRIGRFLLRRYSSLELDENIFEVVRHLNEGLRQISDIRERHVLLNLNFKAGQKARSAAAYAAALRHFLKSAELIQVDSWEKHYALMLSLHVSAAEAAYLIGDFLLTDRLIEDTRGHLLSAIDRVKIVQIHALSLIGQGKAWDGIDVAIRFLRELGTKLPRRPKTIHALTRILRTKIRLRGKGKEDLLNGPQTADPQVIAAKRIMAAIGATSYLIAPPLWAILISEVTYLSAKHGNDHLSAAAFGTWGVIHCALLHDYAYGYEMGQLSLQLLERFDDKSSKPLVLFVWANFIQHWKAPLKETLPYMMNAYKASVELGDLVYLGFSAANYCYHCFFVGKYLPELNGDMETLGERVRRSNQNTSLYTVKMYHQMVLNLMGQSDDPSRLVGKSYNANKMIRAHMRANDKNNLFDCNFLSLILLYLCGSPHLAVKAADEARIYFEAVLGSFTSAVFPFYDSLARLALCSEVKPGERKKLLARIASNQKTIKKYVKHFPDNHLHRFLLVEAQRYGLRGKATRAMALYDQAIEGALKNDFIQDAALAYELAGTFCLTINDQKNAEKYIREAHIHYGRWGATAKVKMVEEKYPAFFEDRSL